MEYYNYIKALHLIFVITWFAGLFYIPRLFIYHIEAAQRPASEKDILVPQFKIMTKRLWYIISWPSAILATFFAAWLLYLMPAWLTQQWMLIKLIFVGLLFAYHLKTHVIYRQLQNDVIRYSSTKMRIWNEGSTIILFAVIFIVMLRDSFSWLFGVLGIIGLGVLLMLGIRLYKRIRG
ncbi:MAG: CopD family protein [Flavobacteriaceae bacterium]|nr:CopD family protein [Flavobacteriaceae bacterium]MDG2314614.1 CopD family protein [Flavobacteriaceae bacterium]